MGRLYPPRSERLKQRFLLNWSVRPCALLHKTPWLRQVAFYLAEMRCFQNQSLLQQKPWQYPVLCTHSNAVDLFALEICQPFIFLSLFCRKIHLHLQNTPGEHHCNINNSPNLGKCLLWKAFIRVLDFRYMPHYHGYQSTNLKLSMWKCVRGEHKGVLKDVSTIKFILLMSNVLISNIINV